MKPTIGRIVHFVQAKPAQYGPDQFVHLPAIIVAVWGDSCVNLQVFTDGWNSEPALGENLAPTAIKWVTSVLLDASEKPMGRSWHWPEQAPAAASVKTAESLDPPPDPGTGGPPHDGE